MPSEESTGSNQLDPKELGTSATGADAEEVLTWRSWGDYDYVAARRLLLDNLLAQGATLANTALEKYLKAILAIQKRPIPRIHDPLNLYRRIRPSGTLSLDEQFLGLLVKAYKIRYPDELKPGFNIVLSQALLLDALDQSVFGIKRHFELRNAENSPVNGFLDSLLEAKDARILTSNTALGIVTRDDLLGRPSAVFEMRILDNGARMEIH
jgi:HEPN domain-containing protein